MNSRDLGDLLKDAMLPDDPKMIIGKIVSLFVDGGTYAKDNFYLFGQITGMTTIPYYRRRIRITLSCQNIFRDEKIATLEFEAPSSNRPAKWILNIQYEHGCWELKVAELRLLN